MGYRQHTRGYSRRYEVLVQLRVQMGEALYTDFLTDMVADHGTSSSGTVDRFPTLAVMWLVRKVTELQNHTDSPKVVKLYTIAEKISA